MKYGKNSIIRIIYFVFLTVIYFGILKYYNFVLNTPAYGIFILIIFFYYLANILNFYNHTYTLKETIYSLIINFLFFTIFYFFRKEKEIIYIYLIYSVLQVLLKYIFNLFSQKVENLIIIDSGEYTEKLIDILKNNKDYKYLGYVGKENRIEENYLGKIENIEITIKDRSVDVVLFTSRKQAKEHADLLLSLKMRGIKLIDYISFIEWNEGKIDIEKIDSLWFLMTDGFDALNNAFNKRMKRMLDILASFMLLIFFLPFIILTYILVKLDIGMKYLFINPIKILKNPAFFKQKRIGKNGKEFEIIKFRSMKIHDPQKFSKYASENDDRITLVGKFIRKTRLDELPQLLNILKGEMSFVGPRPEWNELGREYEKKIKNYKARYAVQPGLTGWAQVMYTYGASLEDAKVKLEYDLYYIKHQSFILDIIIFFKTCKIVVFGKGR
ncbi:exopolysaccharide biosynthesis polyprenyl glycosylphosphotransferase [Fusobacterium gastrosuis]|uniref:exopolysaccharide biosynthesis polyprenyl glycosylphosphotransferase n=1 Tax=Fusobacterium gastrosuis TaxID=1755100 RepID=UPI002A94E1EE|nr:exopolysaccharide biosynthesis polyprenyl glycosylphosphotransferase [Fusobacterium gastrosuis]